MAYSINTEEILGNLTRDVDIRRTQNGRSVCTFTVATSRTIKDKEYTDFIPVQVWGNLAEACASALHKGSRVFVRGRFSTRSYESNGQKRYFTQIDAEMVALPLSAPKDPGSQKPGTGDFSAFGPAQPEPKQYEQDEIPF